MRSCRVQSDLRRHGTMLPGARSIAFGTVDLRHPGRIRLADCEDRGNHDARAPTGARRGCQGICGGCVAARARARAHPTSTPATRSTGWSSGRDVVIRGAMYVVETRQQLVALLCRRGELDRASRENDACLAWDPESFSAQEWRAIVASRRILELTFQLTSHWHIRTQPHVSRLDFQWGLAPTHRLRGWRRLRGGEADVVVGPCNAVFAPVESTACRLPSVILPVLSSRSQSIAEPIVHGRMPPWWTKSG